MGDGPVVVSSQLADLEVTEPRFRFAFQAAFVDQGQRTNLLAKIEQNKPFDGPATVELLGLPNEVTSQPQQITKDSTEIVFPIATTANSPPGLHKTLLCRAVVTSQGEPITHLLGGGELRIQKPPPPKAAQPTKPVPTPTPTAAAAASTAGAETAQPAGTTSPGAEGRQQGNRRNEGDYMKRASASVICFCCYLGLGCLPGSAAGAYRPA